MNERLKKLRKELDITQQEFADNLEPQEIISPVTKLANASQAMLLSLLYVRQTSQKEESMRPGCAPVKGKCLSKRLVMNRSPLSSAAF